MALKFSVRLAEEAAMSLIKIPEEKSGCEEETSNRKVGLLSNFLSGRSPRDSQIKGQVTDTNTSSRDIGPHGVCSKSNQLKGHGNRQKGGNIIFLEGHTEELERISGRVKTKLKREKEGAFRGGNVRLCFHTLQEPQ